jgi:lichenan operon transcriptional antiterminator
LDVNQFIISLFDPRYFQIDTQSENYLEILAREGNFLEKEMWVENGFKKSVLEREKMIDTIYQNGVAGPHPMEQVAIKEVIDVVLLRKPVMYGEKGC